MKQNVLKYLFFGIFIGTLSIIFTNCKDNDDDIKALQLTQQELSTALNETTAELTALKGQVSTAVETKIAELLADVATLKTKLEVLHIEQVIEDYLKVEGKLTAIADLGDFQIKLNKVTADELATLAGIKSEVDRQGFTTLAALLVSYQSRITELETQTLALADKDGALTVKGAIEAVANKLDANLEKIKAVLFDWDGDEFDTWADYLDKYDYITKADLAAVISELGDDMLILKLKALITGISLVKEVSGDQYVTIPLYVSVPATYTFGTITGNTISFAAEGKQAAGPQFFIVQVTPANVDLRDYKLSFVNSLGQQVGLKNITISKYDGLLTRVDAAPIVPTGLFKITFEWDNTPADADFGESASEVRYALSVDKTGTEGRTVLTGYDILFTEISTAIHNGTVANVNAVLDFTVAIGNALGTSVQEIKNEYDVYADQKWSSTTYTVTDADNGLGDADVTENDETDDRNGIPALSVELGQSITVTLGDDAKKALAYYVALENAERSGADPDDITAWGKLVTGDIDKVTNVNDPVDIFIKNDAQTLNELKGKSEIGFRLFAVNTDGTLVDPDGRAFYISLSESTPVEFTATIEDAVPDLTTGVAFAPSAASFIKNLDSKTRANIKSVTLTFATEADAGDEVTEVGNDDEGDVDTGLKFVDGNGNSIDITTTPLTISPLQEDGKTVTTWTAIDLDKISIEGLVIPSSFGTQEITTVAATIAVKGESDDIISTYPVTLTRELKLETLFASWTKSHSVYLSPAAEGTATAELGGEGIFGDKIDPDRLIVSLTDGDKTFTTTKEAPLTLTIAKNDIGDAILTPTYAVKVDYNYGYIYSSDVTKPDTVKNISLSTFSFGIKFATELPSMIWNVSTTAGWTPEQGSLIYGKINTISLDAFTSRFKGINYTLIDENGKPEVDASIRTYELADAKLITEGADDVYYTIEVSPEDNAGKLVFTPKGPVVDPVGEGILKLTIKDIFGGDLVTKNLRITLATE
ncbi:hypothetical protein EZS27_025079 [termite gut metagenome]|uniref:Uncharacterized protein n=1 Tax=termite gut metagenome TaxID=433724 RepID=A0A5J4QW64_9ZZZZ